MCAMRQKEGAFSIYEDRELALVGYTSCDGCPGGNVGYAGEEMATNGANVIHLATGLVVGYLPCPPNQTFKDFLEARYEVKVVVDTHTHPAQRLGEAQDLGDLGRSHVGGLERTNQG